MALELEDQDLSLCFSKNPSCWCSITYQHQRLVCNWHCTLISMWAMSDRKRHFQSWSIRYQINNNNNRWPFVCASSSGNIWLVCIFLHCLPSVPSFVCVCVFMVDVDVHVAACQASYMPCMWLYCQQQPCCDVMMTQAWSPLPLSFKLTMCNAHALVCGL